jgi:hypothetical protein
MKNTFGNRYLFFLILFVLLIGCSESNDKQDIKQEPGNIKSIEAIYEYDMLKAIDKMAIQSHKDKDYQKILNLATELAKTDTVSNAADLVYAAYLKVKPKSKNLNYYFGTGKEESDSAFNDTNTIVFIKSNIRMEFNSDLQVVLEQLKKYNISIKSVLWYPPKWFKVAFECRDCLDEIKNFRPQEGNIIRFDPVLNSSKTLEMFFKMNKKIVDLAKSDKLLSDILERHFERISDKKKRPLEINMDFARKFPLTHILRVYLFSQDGSSREISFENYAFPQTDSTSYYRIVTDTSMIAYFNSLFNHPEVRKLYPDSLLFISASFKTAKESNGFVEIYSVSRNSSLNDRYIKQSTANYDEMNMPVIMINFNEEGAKAFEMMTENNVNNRIAISIRGEVYSAPIVKSKINGGEAKISGLQSIEEAKFLESLIKSGTSDWSIKLVDVKYIDNK